MGFDGWHALMCGALIVALVLFMLLPFLLLWSLRIEVAG